MRTNHLLAAIAVFFLANDELRAQELKPMSPTELDADYRKDKLSSTLKDWSKAEVKAFKKECEQEVKGKVADPRSFCSCAQPVVAANLNYSTFMDQSEYQRGRALGYLTRATCK